LVCLIPAQKEYLKLRCKDFLPKLTDFHDDIIAWIDDNTEQECIEKNIELQPPQEVLDKVTETKFQRAGNFYWDKI